MSAVITVTQLNKYVKSLFDGDNNLKSVFVSGEISNLKINSFSGHMYFTLKDKDTGVRAVMFKNQAAYLKFLPEEGMSVICRGSVTVYERDGQYQLYVNDMQPDGAGSIALAFEQLKAKLAAEGLFDQSRKKQLPPYPKKIAIITSKTGAAVHDMINVISRRFPLATLLMCPVSVQGENAAPQMIEALNTVNSSTDCDVVIIGRGGGSAEDLWCFNDEQLARTIAESNIPVISAVGHETDFTICDFVADLRAPTPSAAAEIAVPDIKDIYSRISLAENRMKLCLNNKLTAYVERLKLLSSSRYLQNPEEFTENLSIRLDGLYARLEVGFTKKTATASKNFATLLAKLDALDPMKILKRGYTVATKDDKSIISVDMLEINDEISLKYIDGIAKCRITDIERKNLNG